jgi:hypothetical protein
MKSAACGPPSISKLEQKRKIINRELGQQKKKLSIGLSNENKTAPDVKSYSTLSFHKLHNWHTCLCYYLPQKKNSNPLTK